MTKILVLGTGQIGAFAARAIAAKGFRVVAADREPAMGYFARFGPQKHCDLYHLDVLDCRAVVRVVMEQEVDTIVVTFGLSGTASAQQSEKAWEINVRGPETVAIAASEAGIKRLVFVSSFAVYGRQPIGRLSETIAAQPESEYGRMKLAAETALLPFRAEGLDLRILRPCGVYGPLRYGKGSHSAKLVEALLLGGLKGRELVVRASSTSADEYIYIKDLGEAISAATLVETGTPEYIYNVGTGEKVTAESLHTALQQVFPNLRLRIEPVEPEHERMMPPLDISRIRKVFGFAPKYNLVAGLTDYVREAEWTDDTHA